MEVISISTCENETQEIRNYEPLREVSRCVNQVQLAICNIESALNDMCEEVTAPPLSMVRLGLKALEESDKLETALWKTREELTIMQSLDSSEENLALFQCAFRVIRDLMQTVSEAKAAVRNIMTSPGQTEGYLTTARQKTRLLKVELPGITEAVNEIEL